STSLYSHLHHPTLHPFPTRRSSDLFQASRQAVSRMTELEELLTAERKRSAELAQRCTDLEHLAARVKEAEADRFRSAVSSSSNSDRKSTRLNSSHVAISYAVFCLKK